jgi:hypothetical protein
MFAECGHVASRMPLRLYNTICPSQVQHRLTPGHIGYAATLTRRSPSLVSLADSKFRPHRSCLCAPLCVSRRRLIKFLLLILEFCLVWNQIEFIIELLLLLYSILVTCYETTSRILAFPDVRYSFMLYMLYAMLDCFCAFCNITRFSHINQYDAITF